MKAYTLGIDLGPTSIGWAAVADKPVEGEQNLIAGVRIFPEGVDRDTKGLEKSKMAQRREARQMRRQHDRKARRKQRLSILLRRAGLLPPPGPEWDALCGESPYQLRRRGLDEKLTPHEFGRALVHLNQRRGFRSSRKSANKGESKIIGKAVSELRAKIEAAGARTLGEYLAGLEGKQRLRNLGEDHSHHAGRKMVQEEFEKLWAAQAPHHPALLTDALKREVADTIFHQRPLKLDPGKIGQCELIPTEKRAPRALWLAQRVRVLQDVNNMHLILANGERRGLSTSEREKLLDLLSARETVKMEEIRAALGMGELDRINLEREKRKTLPGNGAEATLRKVFKQDFDERADFYRNEVWESLVTDPEEEFERKARAWGLTDKQIAELFSANYPNGHARLSKKAMQALLPHLEAGKVYSEAKQEAGLEPKPPEALPELPPAPRDIPNPIVRQALVEVRRVVNLLIREHGRPSKIVVELARETKGSSEERNEMLRTNRQRDAERREIAERIRSEFGVMPTGGTILKYRLWKEQQELMAGACPYCGERIDETALMAGNPDYHVDHILPYSRSLDDSFNNKVVCHTRCNAEKGDELPAVKWPADTERGAAMLNRVAGLPWPKRSRFMRKEIDLDTVIARQLNDTRYICRVAREYLQRLYGPGEQHLVTVTRGQVTSELRYRWGLNTILSPDGSDAKNRMDHRHHAVDAVVIALTTHKHVHNLAHREDFENRREDFPPPEGWRSKEAFRAEVARVVEGIKVSWKALRHVRGALHEETNYGRITGRAARGEEHVYVRRKPLDAAFTKAMAENIQDEKIRQLVLNRLAEHGDDPKKAFAKKLFLPNRRGQPVCIRRVRVREIMTTALPLKRRGEDRPYRWVKPGSNHHIAIFERPDGRRVGVVVSMHEAAQRVRHGRPVIERTCAEEPEAKFLFSLSINETVREEGADEPGKLWRVQEIWSSQTVVLRPVTLAVYDKKDKYPLILRRQPTTLKARKVVIDPLGREFPAND